MIYKLTEIARDVRIAIDQNMTSEQLLATDDIETLSLEDIIRSKIVEAVRRVETAAPVHFLEEGHDFGDAVYWGDLESGWVLLPDDFMRLIAFRMSDWERTVYAAISVDDPLYAKQSSRYKGIRGNVQKPVCAVVNRAEGKALEFYSCNSEDAFVSRASYLPYPHIDEDDGIDISERCYTAVVYTVAALVLTTYGEADKASALTELAKSILQ
ncbi:hypothetical protein [Muribaculum intestinale]|jgi:hypothetical protein|uniref:hypothetical protein n=1 Tax=Muribaculum intestinale TaxID=1796646 RepID=UPI0025B436FA|nr:hypothetical protein [Muribaculum intestinale]